MNKKIILVMLLVLLIIIGCDSSHKSGRFIFDKNNSIVGVKADGECILGSGTFVDCESGIPIESGNETDLDIWSPYSRNTTEIINKSSMFTIDCSFIWNQSIDIKFDEPRIRTISFEEFCDRLKEE